MSTETLEKKRQFAAEARRHRWPKREIDPKNLRHSDYVTPEEAAQILGMQPGGLYNLLHLGEFGTRLPNGWVITVGELEGYRQRALEENKRPGRTGPRRIAPKKPICDLPPPSGELGDDEMIGLPAAEAPEAEEAGDEPVKIRRVKRTMARDFDRTLPHPLPPAANDPDVRGGGEGREL